VQPQDELVLDETSIDQRLTALEQEVALLKRKASENWLDNLIGSISDEEAYLKAIEYGREYRDADKSED
jgi:hypothetical protein